MNDFTVLIQIEKQMQDEFHATEEAQPDVVRYEPKLASWRLRLSALLRTLANTIEPSPASCEPAIGKHA